MKVLITGGTGLIGSALARSLVQDGHEVVVLTRNPNKDKQKVGLPSAVRLVKWDGKTGRGWSEELDGADAIVNLAGETISPQLGGWGTTQKAAIKQSRIDAAKAVVDAVSRANSKVGGGQGGAPRLLIQSSAIGYYGVHDDELITEASPAGDDFLADVGKVWEAASQPVEAMGVRRVIIRIGIVFSDKGGPLPLLSLPFKLFVGGPVGSGKQYLSWIHIEDEVGAIRFLLDNEQASGVYNLTAPNPVTNKEFAEAAGKALSRPSFFPTPAFMLKIVLGDASTIALDGQRVIPKRLQEAGYQFKFTHINNALNDLL